MTKKKEDNNSVVGKGSRSNGGAINPRDMGNRIKLYVAVIVSF